MLGPLGAEQHNSEVIVELVVLSQVDPAEDESSEGQSEHHNEHGRASVALTPRVVSSGREGAPARCSIPLLLSLLLSNPLVVGRAGVCGRMLTPPQTDTGTGVGLSIGAWPFHPWAERFLQERGGQEGEH